MCCMEDLEGFPNFHLTLVISVNESTFLSRNINDYKLAFSFGCLKTRGIGNLKQHETDKPN